MFSLNSANSVTTRMHSSRMYTVRCSGCPGICLPRGCVPMGCLPGGWLPLGVSATHPCPVHAGIHNPCPVYAGIDTPPWTEFPTHACENITFLQLLLQMVKIFVITVKGLKPASLLCGRPGCTSKTHVRDRIFKLSPTHASVIYQIP